MNIKYVLATGEIICMGYMPYLTPDEGEAVTSVDFDIPSEPINHFTFNGTELVRKEQSVIDAIEAVLAFDVGMFQSDLANLLPSLSNPQLRWEFAALNTYAQNKDFEGMAGYMDMLVAGGAAQQSDDDAVVSLLTKQGIVL